MKNLIHLHIKTKSVLRIFNEKLDQLVQEELSEVKAQLTLLEDILAQASEAYDSLEEALADAIEAALNAALDAIGNAIPDQPTESMKEV